jgi:hypothetical protein
LLGLFTKGPSDVASIDLTAAVNVVGYHQLLFGVPDPAVPTISLYAVPLYRNFPPHGLSTRFFDVQDEPCVSANLERAVRHVHETIEQDVMPWLGDRGTVAAVFEEYREGFDRKENRGPYDWCAIAVLGTLAGQPELAPPAIREARLLVESDADPRWMAMVDAVAARASAWGRA